jgi:GAF domain-containing protein
MTATASLELQPAPAFESAIAALDVHDHLCLIYESEAERLRALLPFFREGLARGDRCLYIVDRGTAATAIDLLDGVTPDIGEALHAGRLQVLTTREAYLRHKVFDPDAMIELLKDSVAGAKAEGYRALRVTGEMTWALAGEPGSERLVEYEAKLNRFFPGHDALAICQYDRRWFKPELIREVIATHPLVIYGDRVCRNFYYVPPDDFLGPHAADREVSRLLQHIEDRERHEEELRRSRDELTRVVRALRALSAGGQALVHASTEEALMHDVCRSLAEAGGYRLVWAGYADHDERRSLRPVAHCGPESDFVETLQLACADPGQGGATPTVQAVRSGRTQVVADIEAEPSLAAWHDQARRRGLRSCVALPLKVAGEVVGVLDLYAAERDAFDTAELELLDSLADDLSFGLATLRDREKQRRSALLLETFIANAVTPLAFLDREFGFVRVNEAYARAADRPIAEFAGRNHFDLFPSDARGIFEDVVRTKTPYHAEARAFVYADHPDWGTTYWDWTLAPILDDRAEVEFLVLSLNDVTARMATR